MAVQCDTIGRGLANKLLANTASTIDDVHTSASLPPFSSCSTHRHERLTSENLSPTSSTDFKNSWRVSLEVDKIIKSFCESQLPHDTAESFQPREDAGRCSFTTDQPSTPINASTLIQSTRSDSDIQQSAQLSEAQRIRSQSTSTSSSSSLASCPTTLSDMHIKSRIPGERIRPATTKKQIASSKPLEGDHAHHETEDSSNAASPKRRLPLLDLRDVGVIQPGTPTRALGLEPVARSTERVKEDHIIEHELPDDAATVFTSHPSDLLDRSSSRTEPVLEPASTTTQDAFDSEDFQTVEEAFIIKARRARYECCGVNRGHEEDLALPNAVGLKRVHSKFLTGWKTVLQPSKEVSDAATQEEEDSDLSSTRKRSADASPPEKSVRGSKRRKRNQDDIDASAAPQDASSDAPGSQRGSAAPSPSRNSRRTNNVRNRNGNNGRGKGNGKNGKGTEGRDRGETPDPPNKLPMTAPDKATLQHIRARQNELKKVFSTILPQQKEILTQLGSRDITKLLKKPKNYTRYPEYEDTIAELDRLHDETVDAIQKEYEYELELAHKEKTIQQDIIDARTRHNIQEAQQEHIRGAQGDLSIFKQIRDGLMDDSWTGSPDVEGLYPAYNQFHEPNTGIRGWESSRITDERSLKKHVQTEDADGHHDDLETTTQAITHIIANNLAEKASERTHTIDELARVAGEEARMLEKAEELRRPRPVPQARPQQAAENPHPLEALSRLADAADAMMRQPSRSHNFPPQTNEHLRRILHSENAPSHIPPPPAPMHTAAPLPFGHLSHVPPPTTQHQQHRISSGSMVPPPPTPHSSTSSRHPSFGQQRPPSPPIHHPITVIDGGSVSSRRNSIRRAKGKSLSISEKPPTSILPPPSSTQAPSPREGQPPNGHQAVHIPPPYQSLPPPLPLGYGHPAPPHVQLYGYGPPPGPGYPFYAHHPFGSRPPPPHSSFFGGPPPSQHMHPQGPPPSVLPPPPPPPPPPQPQPTSTPTSQTPTSTTQPATLQAHQSRFSIHAPHNTVSRAPSGRRGQSGQITFTPAQTPADPRFQKSATQARNTPPPALHINTSQANGATPTPSNTNNGGHSPTHDEPPTGSGTGTGTGTTTAVGTPTSAIPPNSEPTPGNPSLPGQGKLHNTFVNQTIESRAQAEVARQNATKTQNVGMGPKGGKRILLPKGEGK